MDKFFITDTAEEIAQKIGVRMAAIRLSRNLSQAELAARAGISKRSLERLECGTGNPQLSVFVSVCVALGLTDGFESLLPEVALSPEDVFRGRVLRKRTRGGVRKAIMWGDEA